MILRKKRQKSKITCKCTLKGRSIYILLKSTVAIRCFIFYLFEGFFVFVPLASLRSQPTVRAIADGNLLCSHGLGTGGRAGFEPWTTNLQSSMLHWATSRQNTEPSVMEKLFVWDFSIKLIYVIHEKDEKIVNFQLTWLSVHTYKHIQTQGTVYHIWPMHWTGPAEAPSLPGISLSQMESGMGGGRGVLNFQPHPNSKPVVVGFLF